jgi:hypothetical protein
VALVLLSPDPTADMSRATIETMRAMVATVDGELHNKVALTEALAASSALDTGNMEAFYEEARRVTEAKPNWVTIALADPSGQQFVNVLKPFDAPLESYADRESFKRAVTTGKPAVGQIADRCYLEKCRDRLYPEFVLGGVAIDERPAGRVLYHSAVDLLGKTLSFYQSSARHRLEHNFNRAYRYLEAYFEPGQSPYIRFVRKNLMFLANVIRDGDWEKLRRHPPCVMPDPEGEAHLLELALQRVRDWSATQQQTQTQPTAMPATF